MTNSLRNPNRRDALRSRAVAHLKGAAAQVQARVDASAALGVLYDLASSPSTAGDALALLHELQVHQVEVDLQEEELRRSSAELEVSLNRHVQLYDHAPLGYLIVDRNGVLRELNQAGAALLGFERDLLRGRALEDFLTAEAAAALRTMLGRVTEDGGTETADLALRATPDAAIHCLHASACLDPGGDGYLIGLIGGMAKKATPDG